ncbi:unnamed protein product [Brassicogethes aeneus]|uniref:RNA polymerase II subunit A C-terminal domain phosphatase SSU72 n=1 Tax=Brassicogethes aeneus TaxID=1431903 RepID=A0A9P0B9R8_BRAAE|nr:unnamed protein product [Brassicogethes aeneus]
MAPISDLRIAVICSCNMNRSMEAHHFLSKKGFIVKSFGTGDKIKIPGSAADKPNIYDFGITYDEIYQDLLNKDKTLYTQNGMLHTLDRNKRIKSHPEKFQEANEKFDLLITCEEKVYDQVLEFMETQEPSDNSIAHVINFDIPDNLEEATIGAFLISDLCTMIIKSEDLDNDIEEVLHTFEDKAERPILHSIIFN